jgi:hypothetical protein
MMYTAREFWKYMAREVHEEVIVVGDVAVTSVIFEVLRASVRWGSEWVKEASILS